MDVRYHPTSLIPCPLCNQKVFLAYTNRLNSYRKILPKIVMPTIEEDPVDPQPAVLVTQEELVDIQNRVQEALVLARKRHAAGALLAKPEHVADLHMSPI